MKRLRTATMLYEYLDGEMAWRIKEVHQLKRAVQNAKGKGVDTHVRAGVAMLYAHWEGFIKSAANGYINFLSHTGSRNCDLKPCFVALGMKAELESAANSSKSGPAISAVAYLLDEMNKPARLPRADAVSADGNLSSRAFQNISAWIGIDASRYSTRFTLIDLTLLESRNRIAHGEYLSIDATRFYGMTVEILEMLRWFKTDIENAVVCSNFLKAS